IQANNCATSENLRHNLTSHGMTLVACPSAPTLFRPQQRNNATTAYPYCRRLPTISHSAVDVRHNHPWHPPVHESELSPIPRAKSPRRPKYSLPNYRCLQTQVWPKNCQIHRLTMQPTTRETIQTERYALE